MVKSFNTLSASLQVDPGSLAGADHHLFVCGNDAEAKARVVGIAHAYGWKAIIDFGDITGCRGAEMMLPVWIRLWGIFGDPAFNFKIVRG